MSELSGFRQRLDDFVDAEIAEGHFQNAEEVVRAIAQLLEVREKKLAVLRAALDEGESSVPGEPFDLDEFLAEMNRKVRPGKNENKAAAER